MDISGLSVRHLVDRDRMMLLEELPHGLDVEQRVARLDAEEEPVARRQGEVRRVEHRVVRPGQAVEPQHAEDRRQRREEHGHLERDRDERRPAIERPAADVDRVAERGRIPLHEEPAQPADDPADQHDRRDLVVLEPQRVGQAVDRERRVGLHHPVAPARRRAGSPRPGRSGSSNSAISPYGPARVVCDFHGTAPFGAAAGSPCRSARPASRAPARASRRSRSPAGSG